MPDNKECSTEVGTDFDHVVAIMQQALNANASAHALEERKLDPTAKFDEKNRHLIQLYLEYGGSEYVVIVQEGKLIRFSVAGTGLTCHSKRAALKTLIRSNGYPDGVRAALYQDFGIKPPAAPKQREESCRKPRHRTPHTSRALS